jgi:hypothetical protein
MVHRIVETAGVAPLVETTDRQTGGHRPEAGGR